jgi:putative FmdB family regulatory protein
MPIYEYACRSCGHAFEHLARTLRDGARACPKCGAARPVKQFSSFSATVASARSRACDSCRTSPTCPTAGKGCPGAACAF